MTWFLCSVSRDHTHNWELCKEIGLFGYSRGLASAKRGDHLLFWVGGRGYVGYGVVASGARVPSSSAETPWAGGKYRFKSVIPFRLLTEINGGLRLRFDRNVQELTGFNTAKLQRGVAEIDDAAASLVVMRLLEIELETKASLGEGDPHDPETLGLLHG
ncbi:hypothetical protein GCM10009809_39880 [Isoptericola hypogeus]|uniref:EVE domain-containing protein n=1 Tax=Isoptericola hypogeus TaxID=300179 RepID=A0ABP4VWT5_9MICO